MNTKLKSHYYQAKKTIPIPLFIFISLTCFAQKDFNIWHFGTWRGVSLDFNVEPPLVSNSPIEKMAESGASICDPKTGEIILFCNNNTVWNAENAVVKDATGLKGSNSTTQGSLIIPHPCGCGRYFVFQNDIGEYPFTMEDYGLSYSIIDMMLENGLGSVTEKNVPISNKIAEPMVAVKDTANGYWLICHEIESYDYLVYHIGNEGIETNFQRFTTNNFVDNPGQGHLCSTFDGSKIAMGQKDNPFIEILDFDIATGTLASDTTILFDSSDPDYQYALSVVFSPNGKMLYAVDFGHLYQFDFTDKNDFKRNTIYRRDTSAALNAFFSVELAPNGKVYASVRDTFSNADYLGVIEFPDRPFPECSFNPFALAIPQNSFAFGFPAIIKKVYSPAYHAFDYYVDFDIETVDSNKIRLVNKSLNIQSYEWEFGDGEESSEKSLSHIYKNTGEYKIQLTGTNKYGCKKTIEKTYKINALTDVPTLKLYPSPTNDVLTIESTRAIEKITLHSISGQLVLEKKEVNAERLELYLSGFASQLFVVTVEIEGKIFKRKILKID